MTEMNGRADGPTRCAASSIVVASGAVCATRSAAKHGEAARIRRRETKPIHAKQWTRRSDRAGVSTQERSRRSDRSACCLRWSSG